MPPTTGRVKTGCCWSSSNWKLRRWHRSLRKSTLQRRDRCRRALLEIAAPARRIQVTHQLLQRPLINLALEFGHAFQRNPVIMPAPGIELRMLGMAQANIAVAAHQPEQEPDLFLPAILAASFAPNPVLRHVIAQPFASTPEDLHMAGVEADLFLQLAVHRLLRCLATLDPALRELPGVLLDPLAPENLVPDVAKNDSYIRAIAVTINHVSHPTPIRINGGDFSTNPG